MQALADFLHRQTILLPQDHHDDVLQIGEIKSVEDRPVGPGQGMSGRIEREANLIAELHAGVLGDAVRHSGLLPILWHQYDIGRN